MSDKPVSHLRDGKKYQTKEPKQPPLTLQKILRVVNKPYQKTYTNGINIQGEYLKKFGFEIGDKVEVLVAENHIKISKIIAPSE